MPAICQLVPAKNLDIPSLHDLLRQTAIDRRLLSPNLDSEDSNLYLDRLVSLPLTALGKEPTLISAEASAVESELTNLCYREYGTFLSVHQCSAAVKSAFDDFQGSLDLLLGSVPALEDQCRQFTHKAQHLTARRNRSLLVQDHQDKLSDILELPHLMETCVRNGYYQEAMELAAHAKDLHQRYPDVRLITDVTKEVGNVTQLVLAQLLDLLQEPVKLATAIKTVSFLRRLELLDETSLGLAFLGGRLRNFRNQLLQIEKDRTDPVRYLRKYIDHFREHVYDILAQYTVVFDDYDILVSFAGQCATDLAELVSRYIPRISSDPTSMSSILVQLGYCSLSFARIGLDFGPLIIAPFSEAVHTVYSHAVLQANSKLKDALDTATQSRGLPIDAIVDFDQRPLLLAQGDFSTSSEKTPVVSPFPLLVVFVNQHLSALNSLRMLAPAPIFTTLEEVLASSLSEASALVSDFIKEETDEPSKKRIFKHNRTSSAPRAHLFRRNTETQLSPDLRSLKKREAHLLNRAFAQIWLNVVDYLRQCQSQEVFGITTRYHASLQEQIDFLKDWLLVAADEGDLHAVQLVDQKSTADEATVVEATADTGTSLDVVKSSDTAQAEDIAGGTNEFITSEVPDDVGLSDTGLYVSTDLEPEGVALDGRDELNGASEPDGEEERLKATNEVKQRPSDLQSVETVSAAGAEPTLDGSITSVEPMFTALPARADLQQMIDQAKTEEQAVSDSFSLPRDAFGENHTPDVDRSQEDDVSPDGVMNILNLDANTNSTARPPDTADVGPVIVQHSETASAPTEPATPLDEGSEIALTGVDEPQEEEVPASPPMTDRFESQLGERTQDDEAVPAKAETLGDNPKDAVQDDQNQKGSAAGSGNKKKKKKKRKA